MIAFILPSNPMNKKEPDYGYEEEYNKLKENNFKFCFMNKPTHLLDKDWNEENLKQSKEDEIRKIVEKESNRLGMTVGDYLSGFINKNDEEEKRIDE